MSENGETTQIERALLDDECESQDPKHVCKGLFQKVIQSNSIQLVKDTQYTQTIAFGQLHS